MKRGRPAMGPGLVDGLEGSESARRRLKIILETLTGKKSVEEACVELGIGKSAFHKMRESVLRAAIEDLEPKPLGRPPKGDAAEEDRLRQLEREIGQLQTSLKIAHVREELLLAMPNLVKPPRQDGEEKKRPDPPWRRKKRGRRGRRRR